MDTGADINTPTYMGTGAGAGVDTYTSVDADTGTGTGTGMDMDTDTHTDPDADVDPYVDPDAEAHEGIYTDMGAVPRGNASSSTGTAVPRSKTDTLEGAVSGVNKQVSRQVESMHRSSLVEMRDRSEIQSLRDRVMLLQTELEHAVDDMSGAASMKKELESLREERHLAQQKVSQLEQRVMHLTNQLDEAKIRDEQAQVNTKLVASYKAEAQGAKARVLESEAALRTLQNELDDSVFLEQENQRLGKILTDVNTSLKKVLKDHAATQSREQALTVENMKLKKIIEGQKMYEEALRKNHRDREEAICKRESELRNKERDYEMKLRSEFNEKLTNVRHERQVSLQSIEESFAKQLERFKANVGCVCPMSSALRAHASARTHAFSPTTLRTHHALTDALPATVLLRAPPFPRISLLRLPKLQSRGSRMCTAILTEESRAWRRSFH